MKRGLVTRSIKVEVLKMLSKQIAHNNGYTVHGDIKDLLVFWKVYILNSISATKSKPENRLVDYDYKGGVVSKFRCILADWGTAGDHPGGTPLYAGPNTYEGRYCDSKDLFSFGRLALEFFEKGKSQHLCKIWFWKIFCWLIVKNGFSLRFSLKRTAITSIDSGDSWLRFWSW